MNPGLTKTSAESVPAAPPIAERTRRRITRRLIPFLFLLYVISYLDRVNLSFAGLEMTKELHFSNSVFGFGSGIFFIGYVLLEIPGTILVELWSARKWIARIMITWGLISTLTGFIHTSTEFYWARFLLGVAEAGFFPGVIVYISHWFRNEDRAKAMAMFSVAIPASQILGSPISAALMRIHWMGYSGWRWLLILEGAPAVVLGVVTYFYLTDRPKDAQWLPADERDWLTGELDREKASFAGTKKPSVWKSFWHRDVLLLTLVYFFGTNVSYGLTLWLPKMMQRLSGYNPVVVTLISAIPFLATWPFMLLIGWSSDRLKERKWHVAISCFIAGAGLALARSTDNVGIGLFGFTLAAAGIYGRMPPFWAIPNTILSGASAAAVVGSINCFGNLGGFLGPYMIGYLTDRTHNYQAGVLYLVGSAVAAGLLVLLVRGRK